MRISKFIVQTFWSFVLSKTVPQIPKLRAHTHARTSIFLIWVNIFFFCPHLSLDQVCFNTLPKCGALTGEIWSVSTTFDFWILIFFNWLYQFNCWFFVFGRDKIAILTRSQNTVHFNFKLCYNCSCGTNNLSSLVLPRCVCMCTKFNAYDAMHYRIHSKHGSNYNDSHV